MLARLVLSVVLIAVAGCRRPAGVIDAAPEPPAIAAPKPADGPLAASVVITAANRRFVVLDAEPVLDEAAALAPALLVEADPIATIVRPAPEVPASIAALRGHRVRLYGDGAASCDGTLGAPMLLVRSEKESPHESADDLWNGAGAPTLVAEVEGAAGCGAVQWARDRALSEPVVGSATVAEPGARERALSFVRALPAYAEVRKQFLSDVHAPRSPHWEEHEGASPSVVVLRAPGAKYVWVGLEAGAGCGEFAGALSVLLREQSSGFEVVHARSESAAVPVAVVGAPVPTLMFPDARLRADGTYEEVRVQHFGCSC